MNRDPRYSLIKAMVEKEKIKYFNDIFNFIPKTVVAFDIGKKVDRFTTLMYGVKNFTHGEIATMGKLFDLDILEMTRLIHEDYLNQEKGKHTTIIKKK